MHSLSTSRQDGSASMQATKPGGSRKRRSKRDHVIKDKLERQLLSENYDILKGMDKGMRRDEVEASRTSFRLRHHVHTFQAWHGGQLGRFEASVQARQAAPHHKEHTLF